MNKASVSTLAMIGASVLTLAKMKRNKTEQEYLNENFYSEE